MAESDFRKMLRGAVLEDATFLRLTMSGRRQGSDLQWHKAVVRPVLIQGQPRMQFSWFDGRDPDLVREYRELRDFWQVTPTLEGLLGSTFGQHVD